MVIQQTTEELRESIALNYNSALVSIRVTEAELWSATSRDLNDGGEAETEIGFRPTSVRREEDFLGLTIKFHFGLSSGTEKPTNLVRVSCQFEALYSLATDFEPTERQIAAFHKGNAVFNCWPFFREFVQNATVRMHIPPPPVPFLRIMPALPDQPRIPEAGMDSVPATKKAKRINKPRSAKR